MPVGLGACVVFGWFGERGLVVGVAVLDSLVDVVNSTVGFKDGSGERVGLLSMIVDDDELFGGLLGGSGGGEFPPGG